MGAISSFLASFSDSFKAALILWPMLSFAFTLPILAYLYHRDGRLRFSSALAAYVAVLYGAGFVCFTLYPLPSGDSGPGITYGIPPQLDPLNFINDISRDGIKAVFQLLFNIVLFVPLGFISKRLLRWKLLPTTLLSFAVTCLIETAQLTGLFGLYPFAYRTFEVDDLICNTLGGMIGWWCGRFLDPFVSSESTEPPPITNEPGFVRRCVALWVDMVIMGFCAGLPWLSVALATEMLAHQPFCFPGLDAIQTEGIAIALCGGASFIAFEILIPYFHHGSTLGGMLVRMTFETEYRTGEKRLLFYGARSFTLLFLLFFPVYVALPLALFYLITRKMPYDYLPASPSPSEAQP